jgi:hypothetical protein
LSILSGGFRSWLSRYVDRAVLSAQRAPHLAFALHGAAAEGAVNLILALIVALLILSLPTWPYSAAWGYYPSGGLGIVVLILLVLLLTRRRV